MVTGVCTVVEVDGIRRAAEAYRPLPCPQVAAARVAIRGRWLALIK